MPKRGADEDLQAGEVGEAGEAGAPQGSLAKRKTYELGIVQDATWKMWEQARKEKRERIECNERAEGAVMSNALHDHLGNPRKHVDMLVAIAGPWMGVVGKHTCLRTEYGLYIDVKHVPADVQRLFKAEVGCMVDVAEDDLDWYDDVYPERGPLDGA